MDESRTKQVAKLLIAFEDVFAKHDLDLGCFTAIKHHIDTGDTKPIKQRMHRTPLGFEQEEQKHLESMLEAGVMSPSASEWASPPVLVRKNDTLPQIEECLDALRGLSFISTLDMCAGYWQIEMDEESCAKTVFITNNKLPFSLCDALATFQRAIQLVLIGLTWKGISKTGQIQHDPMAAASLKQGRHA